MRIYGLFFIAMLFFLAACAPTTATPPPKSTPISFTKTPSPAVPTASATFLPSATPTSTPAPTNSPEPILLCSPLEDITLAELPEILSNPFEEPPPGRDNGHHGADFSYYSRGTHKDILGLPVNSLMPGRVAAVILNKPPYGNAVIVETSLDILTLANPSIISYLPTPAPTILPDLRLTCPTPDPAPAWHAEKTSLYLLYAHLQSAPLVAVGDTVGCGQHIGNVGTSGMSVNPHLHLEARIGPPAATFTSMGHYGAVSQAEMANYCLWRASQWFQMFDPLYLLPY